MTKSHSKTIGIDASRAVITQRTGTEHYSASLLAALTQLPEAKQYNFQLYVNIASADEARERLDFDLPPNWHVVAAPFPRLWTHLRLSWEMLRRPPGVLFVPSHVVPLWHPRRTVVTVHDLGYLEYPQAHTRASRLYLHLSTFFSARSARRVIAISEATKRDLVKHYLFNTRKISFIYNGRDTIFSAVDE
ncbi:MAG: glycosyltransferase [Chloroflexota bacterium]|nr:glycosyltransferase [Chloroflexota bacterium]